MCSANPKPSIHEAETKILTLSNLYKAREDVTTFKEVKAVTKGKLSSITAEHELLGLDTSKHQFRSDF